jgi:hypothetical protein
MDHEFIWLPRHEKVPERERHTIQSNKCIGTTVWNARGFQLNGVPAKGGKFNTAYCLTELASRLSERRSAYIHSIRIRIKMSENRTAGF